MNEQPSYTLPSGPNAPLWCLALVELAKRAQSYYDAGIQTDAELTARINQVHAAWVAWPKGHPDQLFLREGH